MKETSDKAGIILDKLNLIFGECAAVCVQSQYGEPRHIFLSEKFKIKVGSALPSIIEQIKNAVPQYPEIKVS